ncbi:cation/H(+) antiporter [Niveispirillum sp. SYP-B3756]|uniref:cation:proton antiporter n=1 Tax=Niveispirillum sp. SYP-B3756 TaxID=2662178 RepID=UPI001291B10A|nr:cation:proton antiporter [Niveispirillum sp. SYP-B3756]MQP67741.1 cation/H(+) antiporter [Niveispirillum sp. SYP-B3756]
MEHHVDITGIAIVTSVALLCGLVLSRLKQPSIVGYIVAGIVLGPGGFGLVSQSDSIRTLAELGVLMLLFLVGMELSVKAFQAVWRVALLAVAGQVGLSLAVTALAGLILGWPMERSIVFGFIVALSGTAVAIKMLDDIGELKTETGRVTVGVLIAQDLAFVPLLLITNGMGSGAGLDIAIFLKLGAAVAALGGLVWFLSRRERLIVPYGAWFRRNHDVVPLAALALCFTMAALTGLLGLSTAFGAFMAGFALGNSDGRTLALRATHPIQSVLVVVFFLSIGLLIDLRYVWDHLGEVLLLLFVVTLVKTAINVGTLHFLGEPWERAFPAGVIMGSLGEFSFVLAAAGLSIAAIDPQGYQLAVTVIALSWLASPLWLDAAKRFHGLAAGTVVSLRPALGQIYSGEIAVLNRFFAITLHAASAAVDTIRRLTKRDEKP